MKEGIKHIGKMLITIVISLQLWSLCASLSLAGECSTNDYPYRDSIKGELDVWGFYTRNCTSYVAWKINKDYGTTSAPYYFYNTMSGPNGQSGTWGNAKDWENNATTIGFTVSNTPQTGAIAAWEANSEGAGIYGHVAYVESVNSDGTVNITEYNWNYGDGNCNARSSVTADHYIHILSSGCTDPNAINYDPDATVDDGSCEYAGCTDPNAANYNPDATVYGDNCEYPIETSAFVDVTGNMKADAVLVGNSGITRYCPTGDESWTTNSFYGTRGTYFADVTGDGKADAIVVNDTGVTVRRSTGADFGTSDAANEAWTTNSFYGTRGTYFADGTGDGKADAIVMNDYSVTIRRSTGINFSDNEPWTCQNGNSYLLWTR
ncbi:hypothetical protein U27_06597 [Candidatus Vecturithrix granuli]|uniref:Peptidase C51 domain-containing protein n=1 Tax=Vecturithrix granuli TaxID=1499967 RepID=A0A081C4V7_VECG1|nr:hypothetical protein U27_06597 [Candidatus Vecturithrix granuli]